MYVDPRPIMAFASPDGAAHIDLKRRLHESARLFPATSFDELLHLTRGEAFTPRDSVVIDLRTASPEQRRRIEQHLAAHPRDCRLLVVHGLDALASVRGAGLADQCHIALAAGEPVAPYAAALHYGLDQHLILIAAMQLLAPRLTPIGRRAMYEILGQRFECRNVHCLAAAFGIHRTRLYHLLERRGDPTPKALFDCCHTLVTALLVRHSSMRLAGIARFVRARHARAPREALQRRTGYHVSQLRELVVQRSDAEILRLMLGEFEQSLAA